MADDDRPDGDDPRAPGPSDAEGPNDRPADDEEWRFSIEDVERRETEAAEREAAAERAREPLEAGRPSLENTLFVVLGALLALFVVSRVFVA